MINNDYDEDGNNIVPCPICGKIHDSTTCPMKEAFIESINKKALTELNKIN